MGGGQPRTDNSGDSALLGEFTWKGKHLDPWSGFQWNTSPAFSIPSLKDLSKTLRCDDTMCVMEIVRYDKSKVIPYVGRLKTIQEMKRDYIENGVLPPRKCKNCDVKRASQCNMRDACFNIGKGRVKLSAEERKR